MGPRKAPTQQRLVSCLMMASRRWARPMALEARSMALEARRMRLPASRAWTTSCRHWPRSRAGRYPSIRRSSSESMAAWWTCSANCALVRTPPVREPPVRDTGPADRRGRWVMARKVRLDAELVRRGLARSREQAAGLIVAGQVTVSGQTAAKPATQVGQDSAIVIRRMDAGPQYASRGGHKLAGALAAFPEVAVQGRRCLDAGASTGGFTDVLLRAGAAQVVAADVGYGQLAWPLRVDPRVTVLDRVNIRNLQPAQVAPPPGLITADLSFISLTHG